MRFNKEKQSKLVIIITSFILGVLIFVASYGISYFYNKEQIAKTNAKIEENNDDNVVLEDKVKVILTKRTISDTVLIEGNLLIKDIKESEGLDQISEKQLINMYEDKGYTMLSNTASQIIFEKAAETLEPNKYYIGEKYGFISIFKTDDSGKAFIESNEDISNKRLDDLQPRDQETIKNFNLKFDTKEECEEELTSFIS